MQPSCRNESVSGVQPSRGVVSYLFPTEGGIRLLCNSTAFYNRETGIAIASACRALIRPRFQDSTVVRISVKLTAGVVVIAALVGLVGYFTNLTDHAIQNQVEHLSRSSLIEVVDAADMALAIQTGHNALHDLIARRRQAKPVRTAEADPEATRLHQTVTASLGSFQRSFTHSRQASLLLAPSDDEAAAARQQQAEADTFKQLGEAFTAHHQMVEKCLSLIDKDPVAADAYRREKLDAHFNDVLFPLLRGQKQNAEAEFSHEVHSVERAVAAANLRNTIVTLVALICALALGLALSRSIGAPLAELKAAALRIGKGHLETRLTNRSRDEIGVLAATFNRMAEELQATTVSKAYVDNILQSMSEMVIVVDPQLQIRIVNGAAVEQLGYSVGELIGQPLAILLPDLREPPASGAIHDRVLGSQELWLFAKDGEQIPVHWAGSELRGEAGELQGVVCAALNIAERKRAEAQLRASLVEKEVLLKEVHHRVKNNLQIISSLLALQARDKNDLQVRRMFEESQGRIRSMALIHELLYQSGELSRIDFLEYVRRLCSYLMESTGDESGRVSLAINVAPLPLPISLAIPCGMILNELVSNALKHAFPDGSGSMQITFALAADRYSLSVRDDGPGFDAVAAAGKAGSLGLKVVEALTRQLGGELAITTSGGAEFLVSFPVAAGESTYETVSTGHVHNGRRENPVPATV